MYLKRERYFKKGTQSTEIEFSRNTGLQMMMAYEGFESTRDNFEKFINQFQPENLKGS